VKRRRLFRPHRHARSTLPGGFLDEAILRGLSIGDAWIDIAFRRVDETLP
jgi:hypothetical protein